MTDDANDTTGDAGQTPERRTLSERLVGALANPRSLAPKAPPEPGTEAERQAMIRTVDPTERRYGIVAAVLSLVVGLFISFAVQLGLYPQHTKPTGKPPACPYGYVDQAAGKAFDCLLNTHTAVDWTRFAFMLILSAAILASVFMRRRSILAATTLLAGMAYGLLGLPFIALGGWLLVRAWRVQRFGTLNAREAASVARERRGQPRERRERGKAVEPPTSDGPRRPTTASKRYTPPKPQGRRRRPPSA